MYVQIAMAAFSIISSIAQGSQAKQSANQQASAVAEEGALLRRESIRSANRIEEDGRQFAIDQKMMYIGSGVQIGGSAAVTLAQTDKWAKQEADAERTRGESQYAYKLRSSNITKKEGQSSFMSGVFAGVGKAATIYSATSGSRTPKTAKEPGTTKAGK